MNTLPRINSAGKDSKNSGLPGNDSPREANHPTLDIWPAAAHKLTAQLGDFVISPSRASLERASNNPQGIHTFSYAGAYLELAGDTYSRVRWLTAQRGSVPNSLLIPIERDQTALPGALVLTATPGFGLERALVIPGGTPAAPRAFSLDRACLNPALPAPDSFILDKGTFRVLRRPTSDSDTQADRDTQAQRNTQAASAEVGSTLACRSGARVTPGILTASLPDRWLVWGFSGQVRAFTPKECLALPSRPELKAGDKVQVPVAGEYVTALVRRTETEAGRSIVQHDFAAEPREHCVPILQVARELP